MLCPQCNTASTKRERVNGICPKCNRRFRIETPEPLSDFEVEKAISQVSRKGAHRYTRSQLVAELERHCIKSEHKRIDSLLAWVTDNTALPWILGLIALAFATLFIALGASGAGDDFFGLAVPFAIGTVLCFARGILRGDPAAKRALIMAQKEPRDGRAEHIASTWCAVGDPPGMIPRERALAHNKRPGAREFDLESFGFDRVIVVQGEDMVDMLVANRFHFDHNAAIVSFGGYPEHVAKIIERQMDSGHTRAHVFLLHDASSAGFRLADGWNKSGWASKATIVRVGLAPHQLTKVLPVYPPTGGPAPEWVKPEDAAWLEVGSVPLSSLRPVQIMTVLFNAMTQVDRQEQASDTGVMFVGSIDLSDGGGSYDFG